MVDVDQKRLNRFKFLNDMYNITDGNEHFIVNMWDVGANSGFAREETKSIVTYLCSEGLLKHHTIGGGIGITHHGVVQVENAISNPSHSTKYFPAVVNILNVGNVSGSQIMQGGSHNSVIVNNERINIDSILELTAELRRKVLPELDEIARKEADIDISTIEMQIKSPKPKNSVIGESLKSLVSILENATASVVATELLPKAAALLAGMF